MKKIKSNIIYFIKRYWYLICFCLAFGILDIVCRLPYNNISVFSFYSQAPTFFTIGIILLFLSIFNILPLLFKKIFYLTFISIFFLITTTHVIYKAHFSYYFSFRDVGLAREGLTYLNQYLRNIPIYLIIVLLVIIILSIIVIKKSNKKVIKNDFILSTIFLIFSFISMFYAYSRLGHSHGDQHKFFFADSKVSFHDFSNRNNSFMVCGLYVYTLRDLWNNIIPSRLDYGYMHKEIDDYFSNRGKINPTNEYTGVFKDKNLILIMLENIDEFMISKEITPTIYKLMNNGINFENHFSQKLAPGPTFVTEFISNTGVIPKINNSIPAHDYAENDFSFALPNLFKKAGYITNSYHIGDAKFYNRTNNHLNWGYKKYHDSTLMGISSDNISQDRYLAINGYEKIVHNDKFLSYIITYSPHMPFSIRKPECIDNLEHVKQHTNSTNENYLCALAQAHETDLFFTFLLEKLAEDNKLNNTVLAIYSDHFTYSNEYRNMVQDLRNETDNNLLQRVPFFIWAEEIEPLTVNKVTSSIDILPTISNLFGIDYNPNHYIGTDALSNHHNNFVFFADHSWFDGNIYFKNNQILRGKAEENYIIETTIKVQEKIRIGQYIVLSDYYTIKRNNN